MSNMDKALEIMNVRPGTTLTYEEAQAVCRLAYEIGRSDGVEEMARRFEDGVEEMARRFASTKTANRPAR